MYYVTVGGQKIKDVCNFNDSNYVSLRYLVYALEGITHEQNEAMPRETQRVVWGSNDKWAIFRITDRFTKELKVIEFSTEGLQNNSTPRQREVKINGKPAGLISFVFNNNLNMIGVREFARLAGLEGYLQWYNKDGEQYVDLRIEDPLYGHSSLKAAADAIVGKQGGIPKALNGNFYQVLYGTANKGGKVNRYSGYMFSMMDAMQWLIQTGGDIGFALQIRDTTKAANQVQTAIDGQWEIVQQFVRAQELLAQCGYKVKMPRFFVGTPEENVDVSSYGTGGMIAIYEGMASKLKTAGFTGAGITETLAGIYFGSETAKADIKLEEIGKHLDKQGAKLLWIPYFLTRADLQKIKELSVHFDKVILQPGTFYTMGKYYERYDKIAGYVSRLEDSMKWIDIFDMIAKDKQGKFGVELEFDMGLTTGRSDRTPVMSAEIKQDSFIHYIDKIIPRIGEIPVGIYSGGPNEQGYNNIRRNSNLHNDQNHAPTASGFGTGANYSSLYGGNLVYEINSILFSSRPNRQKHEELANHIGRLRRI
ncbi:MAG: DUF4855 domain-containing protein [Clostridiales bacterium]|nr:DUF4855 domain-containing protein [Clostridiales bacterium]